MYKNVLQGIDQVAIWPVISFLIFFIFFLVLLWWVFTADKTFIQEMSKKPLQDGSEHNQEAEPLNR
ncbi:MAG: cbb3-type cytochrome c oxidase subunit 3 [Cyclobacteriaceae bacterium]|jgi:cytochrome c oxidase cbb3-type subunit IV|nr:cbb3-type cytochrome c oxidase subunit 3 [Cyclobacteriaceae bacterium]